jgi:hypothetical protein
MTFRVSFLNFHICCICSHKALIHVCAKSRASCIECVPLVCIVGVNELDPPLIDPRVHGGSPILYLIVHGMPTSMCVFVSSMLPEMASMGALYRLLSSGQICMTEFPFQLLSRSPPVVLIAVGFFAVAPTSQLCAARHPVMDMLTYGASLRVFLAHIVWLDFMAVLMMFNPCVPHIVTSL